MPRAMWTASPTALSGEIGVDIITPAGVSMLTPTEARALAAALIRAADAVEPMVERSCYTCAYNKNAVCYHPPDELEMAIDQYAIDAGCAKNNGGLPLDRSIPCPGHAPKVTT